MSLTNNLQKVFLMLLLDMLISGVVALVVYFMRGTNVALTTGLSVFIAFSPICLALTAPLVLHFTRKKLSRLGITLNNPEALKTLTNANVVALPFNRVLTCNDYYITDMIPVGMSQSSLLAIAASAEQESGNILGRSIHDEAKNRSLKLYGASNFKEFPGRGVEATVNKTLTRVGNIGWIEEFETAIRTNLRTRIDQFIEKGKTPLVVTTGRVARGIIALKDEFNDEAKKFLEILNKVNIKSLLLTALPQKIEHCIEKEEFLLDYVRTNLTPEGKAREVQIFRAKGRIVVVIGNDENDLPALKIADVSIFLKGGTLTNLQIRNTKHDFYIPKLRSFLALREIALKVDSVFKLNQQIAFLSWVILVPPALLSALTKSPIPFHPLIAAAGVVIFSILILANSLRVK